MRSLSYNLLHSLKIYIPSDQLHQGSVPLQRRWKGYASLKFVVRAGVGDQFTEVHHSNFGIHIQTAPDTSFTLSTSEFSIVRFQFGCNWQPEISQWLRWCRVLKSCWTSIFFQCSLLLVTIWELLDARWTGSWFSFYFRSTIKFLNLPFWFYHICAVLSFEVFHWRIFFTASICILVGFRISPVRIIKAFL